MSRQNLPMLVVLFCAVAGLAACGKSDQSKIQGTWQTTELRMGTTVEPVPPDMQKNNMIISADTIKSEGANPDPANYTLNSSTSPKQIDITPIDGSDKGQTLKGIYELTDDTLKLNLPKDAKADRPTSFTGPDAMVMTLKRKT